MGGTEVGRSATAGIGVVSEEEVGETDTIKDQIGVGECGNELGGRLLG